MIHYLKTLQIIHVDLPQVSDIAIISCIHCPLYTLVTNVAYKVIVETTSFIKDSQIGLEFLADKMLEKRIISEERKREVTDRMIGLSTDERIGLLLDTLRTSVKVDESIFGWFVQVLLDYNTVLTKNTADMLKKQYNEIK